MLKYFFVFVFFLFPCAAFSASDPPSDATEEESSGGGEAPESLIGSSSETLPGKLIESESNDWRIEGWRGPRKGKARPPLIEKDDVTFDLGVEYRLRNIYVNPLQLNGTDVKDIFYGVQRLRTDWLFGWKDKVRIKAQVDFLDGVLVGDNGTVFGESPFPNEGMSTTARNPNEAGLALVLKPGADSQNSDSYTYGLRKIEPVKFRRVWGEVSLAAFELRVGRMPANEGRGILMNDGDNDLNRFGVADGGDTMDRIVLGTKPIEVVKAIMAGNPEAADDSKDRGLFVGFAYDQLVEDGVQYSEDDAMQLGGSVYYLLPEFDLFGIPGGDLKASFSYARRTSKAVELDLNIFVMELRIGYENFHLETQASVLTGRTKEVSNAQSLFRTEAHPVVQDIRSWGMFAIADYEIGPVTLTFEFDYATGDSDPRHDSTLEHFYFATDTKVGLLLFPHILAFETARSAAAATEYFKRAGSASYPSSQIDTGGCFTNAIAVFPQATWNITDDIFFRAGVLMAWAEEPVVDPYETLRHFDGVRIDDDLVNYNGGKPGDYYGTEIDMRFTVKLWEDHFIFDLEGAVLLPGDALQDINGDAVTSGLIEGRFTFRF